MSYEIVTTNQFYYLTGMSFRTGLPPEIEWSNDLRICMHRIHDSLVPVAVYDLVNNLVMFFEQFDPLIARPEILNLLKPQPNYQEYKLDL